MQVTTSKSNYKLNILSIDLFLFLFLLVPTISWCQSDLDSKPVSEGPLKVNIGYSIINITGINEKEETIEFDSAIFLRWKDERLAYKTSDSVLAEIDYSNTPEVVFQSKYKVSEIYKGWRPFLYLPNGIGNRNITNQSIQVWPDGTVQYNELFKAIVETPMDLRLYPFDSQDLVIYFHPSIYNRNELVLVPDPSLSKTWDQNMGIADWSREMDSMSERVTELRVHDGTTKPVSEFLISLKVKRKPMHVVFGILFPMMLLVSLTWIVFWLDKKSTVDRISILFIGILTVVSYYFVIQDSIPEISYLTLIDAFVVENFLVLAASVIVTMIIGRLDHGGKKAAGDKLNKIIRWVFPAGYVFFALIIYLFFAWNS